MMETENDKLQSLQNSVSEDSSTREGGFQEGGFSPRPRQRARIGQRAAYSSDRGPRQGYRPQRPTEDDGEFRPEGFGANLTSNRPQREESGYQQSRGGYQQSQYRPQYNNSEEGYQPRGGYGQQRGGGYGQQRGGGYGQQRGGGYGQPQRGGGYGQQRGGGYGQPQRGGGYGQPQRGGYGPQRGGGFAPQRGPQRQHTPGYNPNAKYSMKKRIEYAENNIDPTQPLRLNKFLANAGVCSRREADDFIEAGVVTVNGQVVTELGTKVLRTDTIMFHDQPVTLEKKVYVLLNKPKDYVTTTDDPQQRKVVMDLVKDACPERIYPVGRLDRNTTGVLLLTNDGDLASKLTHPKFLKKKVYHVYLDKPVTAYDMSQILNGITLDDGDIKADALEYASPTDKKQVGIEIHSGKNRIVRRIFESLGYHVTKLDRVQFAGLTKKNLRRGDWRFLTEKEVEMLRMGAFE